MRLHVVSDVHGTPEALARAGEGADAVICLGDMVLYLDYDDPTQGIYADLFGPESTRTFIDLRTQRRFAEARAFSSVLWEQIVAREGRSRPDIVESKVRAQYAALFAALPEPAYLTFGNVDIPHYWPDYVRPGHQVLDGEVTDIGGLRVGFVGGGLVSPMNTPYELTPEEYADMIKTQKAKDIQMVQYFKKVG